MHKKVNEERRQHTKERAADYNGLPLPWNKRKLSERNLVLGIDETAAFRGQASGAAVLRFILFCQVGSSSPVFDWRFMESGLLPLARASVIPAQPRGILQ